MEIRPIDERTTWCPLCEKKKGQVFYSCPETGWGTNIFPRGEHGLELLEKWRKGPQGVTVAPVNIGGGAMDVTKWTEEIILSGRARLDEVDTELAELDQKFEGFLRHQRELESEKTIISEILGKFPKVVKAVERPGAMRKRGGRPPSYKKVLLRKEAVASILELDDVCTRNVVRVLECTCPTYRTVGTRFIMAYKYMAYLEKKGLIEIVGRNGRRDQMHYRVRKTPPVGVASNDVSVPPT